jgi:SPP1 family predicted phage head-tail adaptor
MPVNAGELDRRIRIQYRANGRDAAGQPNGSWTLLAEVWAKPMPKAGREFFAGGQLQAELGFVWRIRHRTDVTAAMRVLDDADIPYEIAAAPVPDARREWLDLPCLQGVRAGR